MTHARTLPVPTQTRPHELWDDDRATRQPPREDGAADAAPPGWVSAHPASACCFSPLLPLSRCSRRPAHLAHYREDGSASGVVPPVGPAGRAPGTALGAPT